MKRNPWLAGYAIGSVLGAALLLVGVLWLVGGFEDLGVSGHGLVALVGTFVLVIIVGVGLMALVFYSHRSGRDEAVYGRQDPSLREIQGERREERE